MQTLTQRTLHAFKWMSALQLGRVFIGMMVSLILARLLLPEEFGLASLVTVTTAILITFVEFGFNAAIIQRKTIGNEHIHTSFLINLCFGLVITTLTFILAPAFGRFYNEPRLIPLLQFFSIIFIIHAFSTVQIAVFQRGLDFKKVALISLFGFIFGSIIKLFLAKQGYGSWSIVVGEVCNQGLISIAFWIINPIHINTKYLKKQAFADLFSFGFFIMLTNLIGSLSSKLDVMVVGKLVSSRLLGIYSIAFTIATIIPHQIDSIIQRVMFPSLSLIQDDLNRLRNVYLRAIRHISILSLPINAGLLMVAHELIIVFLPDRWIEAIPIIQLLCLYSMTNSLGGAIWGQVIKARGKAHLILYTTITRLVFLFIFILIGSRWGLVGIATAIVVYGLVFRLIFQSIVNREIGISMLDYFTQIFPALSCTGLMMLILFALKQGMSAYGINDLFNFIITIVVGIAIYAVSLQLLWKRDLAEILNIIKKGVLRK